ncbi:MAG: hypothetical protein K0Q73_5881 [Paenibacillus sp.]|jgi:hypothetical protein|nr:hypothetical protein [Paenibacillus sp.]
MKRAEHEVFIVSPYVTKEVVAHFIKQNKKVSTLNLRFVTRPPGIDYVTGATDPEALLLLQQAGFKIRMLPKLHAKLYVLIRS